MPLASEEGGHEAIHSAVGHAAKISPPGGRAAAATASKSRSISPSSARPDHPWLKQHPGWFNWRPDGTIKYAENPPKKYQDIVNVDFYAADGAFPALWVELRDIVVGWVRRGREDLPRRQPAHQAACRSGNG